MTLLQLIIAYMGATNEGRQALAAKHAIQVNDHEEAVHQFWCGRWT